MKSFVILSFFALILAGCDAHYGKDGGGRVCAVVNGVEITLREIDFLCRRSTLSGSDRDAVRRSALALLIRNELLAQKASEMKLEKSPDFVVALYEARRTVLAGMAEQHIAAQAGNVSVEAVKKIIADNPLFFSKRKLLVYDQVVIPDVDELFLRSLNAEAERGASLNQLLDKVNAKKMPFRRTMQSLTTEQIDPGIFSVLKNLSLNRARIARIEKKFSLILMLRARVPMPLEGEEANQAAAGILHEQQRKMELSKTLAKAIASSKITCFGEFASGKSGNKGPSAAFDLPILP